MIVYFHCLTKLSYTSYTLSDGDHEIRSKLSNIRGCEAVFWLFSQTDLSQEKGSVEWTVFLSQLVSAFYPFASLLHSVLTQSVWLIQLNHQRCSVSVVKQWNVKYWLKCKPLHPVKTGFITVMSSNKLSFLMFKTNKRLFLTGFDWLFHLLQWRFWRKPRSHKMCCSVLSCSRSWTPTVNQPMGETLSLSQPVSDICIFKVVV